jgi:hypothetical protein
MPTFEYEEMPIEVDPEGYLVHFDDWNERVACRYQFRGRMVGGFGLVAYPAAYGRSAIMTFMVNRDGQVYE